MQQDNQALFDRLAIIDSQLREYQRQLEKVLDLYISGEFPKEILTERKSRLEEATINLLKEHNDLEARPKSSRFSGFGITLRDRPNQE